MNPPDSGSPATDASSGARTCAGPDELVRLLGSVTTGEGFIRQVLATSLDCVKVLDLEGNLLFLNDSGAKVLEIPEIDKVLHTRWTDWWPESARAKAEAAVAGARAGKVKRFEAAAPTRGGTPKWWEVTVSPIEGSDGRPARLLSVSRDITERKSAQHALLESEQHLRLIFESVKDYAIFTLDPAGVVTSWNAGAERTFGHRAAEILGRSGAVLWLPEDQTRGGPAEEMRTAIEQGVAEDRRWHLRKDGSRFFANGMLRPMFDEAGKLQGFTKVCRDVTAETTAEQELAEARRQIAEALEAERARLAELFQRSPSFMAVLRGADYVFEMVNEQYYRLVGERTLIGRSIREALPEIKGQGFFRLLDQVYTTGEPYVGKGMLVRLRVNPDEPAVERYVDFVFQPMHGAGSGDRREITGIFAHGVDVTERQRAEVTAQRLAAIVDSSDDAIVGKDLTSIVTSWNAGAERIFGYTASEMIGTSIKRIIPADRQGEEDEILSRIARGERVDHLETIRVTKTGELLDISVTISPIKDSSGRVVGVSKVARDITPQKRAQEQLRASEQRFRQLWTTTTDAIVIIDGEQHVEYVNPSVERIFGYRPEELLAQGMAPIVPKRLWEAHTEGLQRYLATGERKIDWRATETFGLHRDGHEIPIEISFSHFQENGRDLFAAFIRDISERHRAQEALQRSEALFRELADSMPNIVWAARPDGCVDYYNRRWYEFTGLPEGSTGNESWEPVLHPADVQRTHEAWKRSLQSGEHYEIELRYRRGTDGAFRWHLGRAVPVRDASGMIVRWFGTSTDIHDHKILQQQNEQLLDSERTARTEAERASRMKDEFLATLSHELRTPLNAILGWSQILREATDLQEVTEAVEVIERNARAQTKIIEDLLDMSRIISGKVRLDVQRIDLAPIVETAVESIRPAAEAKGIRLQAVLDPTARPVSGDANRLQQVFWNLLSNAVKFTPRGGRVQVLLERVNSHLEVSVIDTGEGIKPEFLPHVFGRFRQADASTTRKHGGLGLGLAIVKQLVELHGGSVRVKSGGVGQGSAFTVSLPLTAIEPETAPEDERRHPELPGSVALDLDSCLKLSGVKVLVVDDEPDSRALVSRFLTECEAIVRTAGSAEEAFTLLREEAPDVLVSDIGMPEEDGYSLIRRVRALGPERGGGVPAVALTAYARAEDRMKAILAGFQLHVSKPVEGAELLTMVASLAGRTGGKSSGG